MRNEEHSDHTYVLVPRRRWRDWLRLSYWDYCIVCGCLKPAEESTHWR